MWGCWRRSLLRDNCQFLKNINLNVLKCQVFSIYFSNKSNVWIFSLVQLLSRVQLFVTPWMQHASPSPTPGVCSNSCPLSQWCHPTISSSVVPSCLQYFPASRCFPVSQFFASGGQSIGASASVSVFPMNIQNWFSLGLTGLISLQSKVKSLLQHYSSKVSVLQHSAFLMVQLSHPHMTTGKTIAMTRPFLAKKCLCFLICCLGWSWASLIAQSVKSLPAMQETWVWFLSREDLPGEGNGNPLSILAWRIPWTEEPGGLQSTDHKCRTSPSD